MPLYRLVATLFTVAASLAIAEPRVDSFNPQGEAKGVRQVTARFSEPMVAFGDPRLADPFAVKCTADEARLKGKGRWVDARNATGSRECVRSRLHRRPER